MLAVLVAAIATAACVVASLARLHVVLAGAGFHPRVLRESLARESLATGAALSKAADQNESNAEDIESMILLAAVSQSETRRHCLDEARLEIDVVIARLARVPRVCASVATSVAFLCATAFARAGLLRAADVDDASRDAMLGDTLMGAITILSIGILGASICGATMVVARKWARARAREFNELLASVEAL